MIIETPCNYAIIPDGVAIYLANIIHEVGPQNVHVRAKEGQQLHGGPTRYIWEVIVTFPWQASHEEQEE